MHNKFVRGGRFPGLMVGVLLTGILLLSACGSAAPPAPAETASAEPVAEQPTQQAVAQVTESAPTATTATTPTASAGGDAPAATVEIAAPTVPLPATCQAINIPNDERIPAPSAGDWSEGPADAPLTLIEYGDFQ
jgi:vancomycin resistance protein YoaR